MNGLLKLGLVSAALTLLIACGSAPSRPQAVVEGERLLNKGVTAYRNDELLLAASLFTKALAHYQGLDGREGQLQSRINLVEVSLAVGNLGAADTHLTAAERLALVELAGYRPRLLLLRSSLHMAQGKEAQARQECEQLLPQKLGGSGENKVEEAVVREALVNRATLAFALPGDDAALWLARLADVAKGEPQASARLARLRARLAQQQGDDGAAAEQLQQALDLCKALPSRRCIAATLEQWGALLQAREAWPAAQEHYQRALAVRMALLDRAGAAADLRQLAQLSQRNGESARSAELVRWADALGGSELVDWNRLRRETQ